MSDAKVKCSNCGVELTNLTFDWGKKQWVWSLLAFLPMIAILYFTQYKMLRSNREFVTEIEATLIETKVARNKFDILGRLENKGMHTWDRVTVEAEVYDKDGKFLDETSDYLSVTLSPDSKENFRLSFTNPDDEILDKSSKVVLKVTDANTNRF